MLKGKFIAISAYIKKAEASQINNLMMRFKLLQKQNQTKSKASRQREVTNITAKINEIETNQSIQRINETKSWFFEKINKINKPLVNMTKWRKEKTQINNIREKKRT
jgi:hypothetical protein